MLNALIIAVVALSSVWVYLDASKNKIGKVAATTGFFNLSAGGWSVATLFLWVVGFPAYLFKRGALLAKAKQHPVEVKGRMVKAIVLAVIGIVWTLLSISSLVLKLPQCDSSEANALVGTIIDSMPLAKELNARFVSIKEVIEQGFNSKSQIRSCTATLVTSIGEDALQYSIQWTDRGKGTFYVEARIQPQ